MPITVLFPPGMVSVKVARDYEVRVVGDVVFGEFFCEEVTHRFYRVIVGAIVVDIDHNDFVGTLYD